MKTTAAGRDQAVSRAVFAAATFAEAALCGCGVAGDGPPVGVSIPPLPEVAPRFDVILGDWALVTSKLVAPDDDGVDRNPMTIRYRDHGAEYRFRVSGDGSCVGRFVTEQTHWVGALVCHVGHDLTAREPDPDRVFVAARDGGLRLYFRGRYDRGSVVRDDSVEPTEIGYVAAADDRSLTIVITRSSDLAEVAELVRPEPASADGLPGRP